MALVGPVATPWVASTTQVYLLSPIVLSPIIWRPAAEEAEEVVVHQEERVGLP